MTSKAPLLVFVALAAAPVASCKNANASPPPPAAHAVDTVKLPDAPPDTGDRDASAVVRAAVSASIARAKLGATRASNPNVRSFAATVRSDAERIDADARAALGAIVASSAADATAIAATERQDGDALPKKFGYAFDRAFLDAEIAGDGQIIAAIDHLPPPSPKTKPIVDALRKGAVTHRDRAKELESSVPSR